MIATMTRRAVAVAIGLSLAAPAIAEEARLVRDDSLVPYKIVGYGIPEPLTDEPGDPKRGREIVAAKSKGSCLSCHTAPIPEQQFHGTIGPDLQGVGNRYTVPELRLRMVDAKAVNPETSMPAFYKVEGLHRVRKNFRGKPMLTAQEIEDVIAYLMTLK